MVVRKERKIFFLLLGKKEKYIYIFMNNNIPYGMVIRKERKSYKKK